MRIDAIVAVVVFTLLGIYAVSWVIVEHREHACAEHCQAKGGAGYEYKGFSGGGKSLKADSCRCTSAE